MNYARWTTEEELKNALKAVNKETGVQESGVPMTFDNKNLYIDDSMAHNLIVGCTGSGKTQSLILPMLKLSMFAGESVLVNDPKGELYTKNAKKFEDEGYDVILLNFDDPKYGNSWNPLKLPYDLYKSGEKDRALEALEDIGHYLLVDDNENSDPFWTNTTIDYFTGLVLYLFENAKPEEINIASVNNLSTDINAMGPDKFMKSIDPGSNISNCLGATLLAPPETRGSILSVFKQKIRLYVTRESLTKMISSSDFDIMNLSNKKTAIFAICELSRYSKNFISLLITQVINGLHLGGNKDKRFNIIIDEFDEIVPIRDFSMVLNRCRSLKVRITASVKSYVLLNKMYGKEEAEMIKVCFGNIIYLLSDDICTLSDISKNCGKVKIGSEIGALITVEELRTLKPFEAIILKTRMMPIRTKLLPDYETDWGYKTILKEMPIVEKQDVSTFKLKEI